ncbi:hypothetical protein SNE40_003651 [Patella caerulea]|uniref:Uncharacterized protein n=1 Tax=Patella caerulea TaxID=87958 RepID=A0AAN8KH08_PATCE
MLYVFILLCSAIVTGSGLYLSPPYPAGSGQWCFDSRVCNMDECCMPVYEDDGPRGRRGAAPPGKCFINTPSLQSMCTLSKKRAVTRRCHDSDDCADNECCTTWVEQGPIVGREVFEGVCEILGHENSECYPGDHANGTNGKPDGIVPSCPCDVPFTCIPIDSVDYHGSLGICG